MFQHGTPGLDSWRHSLCSFELGVTPLDDCDGAVARAHQEVARLEFTQRRHALTEVLLGALHLQTHREKLVWM